MKRRRFALDLSGAITREQQAALIAAANAPQTRAPRPGQRVPGRAAPGVRGRPRVHVQDDSAAGLSDDELLQPEAEQADGQSAWSFRKQQEQERWQSLQSSNADMAQQHAASAASRVDARRADAALRGAARAVAEAAVQQHCCCHPLVMSSEVAASLCDHLCAQLVRAAGAVQPGEPSQQQPAQLPGQQLVISSMRAVACHTAGASCWLPVPTLRCSCCGEQWEAEPASAGFFGSSPVQPGAWFSTQLLDQYTALFTGGVSVRLFADSHNSTAATAAATPGELPHITQTLSMDARCVGSRGRAQVGLCSV